jgi:hypothetical protein
MLWLTHGVLPAIVANVDRQEVQRIGDWARY